MTGSGKTCSGSVRSHIFIQGEAEEICLDIFLKNALDREQIEEKREGEVTGFISFLRP